MKLRGNKMEGKIYTKQINIRIATYQNLEAMKQGNQSFSDIIDDLYEFAKKKGYKTIKNKK